MMTIKKIILSTKARGYRMNTESIFKLIFKELCGLSFYIIQMKL